jgi:hypothetical protein
MSKKIFFNLIWGIQYGVHVFEKKIVIKIASSISFMGIISI